MIRIRKIPRRDYQSVRKLCDEVLRDTADASVWRQDAEYWGAFDGGELVGFGGLVRSRVWSDTVYFHASGVAEKARGNHLQRRLIQARLRWAKEHGFACAYTYTVLDNPASARSLIACGFKPYWPKHRWAGKVNYWRRNV